MAHQIGLDRLVERRSHRSLLLRRTAISFAIISFILVLMCKSALPVWIYCVLLIVSRVSWTESANQLALSRRAKAGARAEKYVASLLNSLKGDWKIISSVQSPELGDIDFVLTSPQGRTYAIEVKSHHGTVRSNGTGLYRVVDGQACLFEKDFLSQAMREALAVRQRMCLSFVTPLLVFTRAAIELPERKIRSVSVLHAHELLQFLESESNVSRSPAGNQKTTIPSAVSSPAPEFKEKETSEPNLLSPSNEFPETRTHKLDLLESQTQAKSVASVPKDVLKDLPRREQGFDLATSSRFLDIAMRDRIYDIDSPYRVKLHECWQCHETIIVYTWDGHHLWCEEEPPAPIPKSLKYRWSKFVEKSYWANTCTMCSAVQGDFFVHGENLEEWKSLTLFSSRSKPKK